MKVKFIIFVIIVNTCALGFAKATAENLFGYVFLVITAILQTILIFALFFQIWKNFNVREEKPENPPPPPEEEPEPPVITEPPKFFMNPVFKMEEEKEYPIYITHYKKEREKGKTLGVYKFTGKRQRTTKEESEEEMSVQVSFSEEASKVRTYTRSLSQHTAQVAVYDAITEMEEDSLRSVQDLPADKKFKKKTKT